MRAHSRLTGTNLRPVAIHGAPWTNLLWWVLVISWVAFVASVQTTPAERLPDLSVVWYKPAHFDKLVHFAFYGIMAALFFNALMPGRTVDVSTRRRVLLLAFCIPALLGVADELNQLRVPGRTANVWDVVWDWLGAGTAVAFGAWKWRAR